MLIAHMDTVYLRGMLKDQPFRVDGDRAYGLGIADDKQGVALILHTVAMLQQARLQGLRHADRARSTATRRSARPARAAPSPASRRTGRRVLLRRRRQRRWPSPGDERNRLGVPDGRGQGRRTPARARSAASTRSTSSRTRSCRFSDLSQHDKGLKLNWTVSQAGTNRNVIPAQATAQGRRAGAKSRPISTELQATLQERVKTQSSRRHQGAGQVRDAPPAARSDARLAPPRRPRRSHLRGDRLADEGRSTSPPAAAPTPRSPR